MFLILAIDLMVLQDMQGAVGERWVKITIYLGNTIFDIMFMVYDVYEKDSWR